MNAPAEDMKDLLEATSSLGLTFATNLFVGEMPDFGTDEVVSVYDTPGAPPEPGFVYQKPSVQVRVRGNKGDYLNAQELAQACRDVLHGTANETVNDARYIQILCESDVAFISYDDNKRPLFSVNFTIHRTST